MAYKRIFLSSGLTVHTRSLANTFSVYTFYSGFTGVRLISNKVSITEVINLKPQVKIEVTSKLESLSTPDFKNKITTPEVIKIKSEESIVEESSELELDNIDTLVKEPSELESLLSKKVNSLCDRLDNILSNIKGAVKEETSNNGMGDATNIADSVPTNIEIGGHVLDLSKIAHFLDLSYIEKFSYIIMMLFMLILGLFFLVSLIKLIGNRGLLFFIIIMFILKLFPLAASLAISSFKFKFNAYFAQPNANYDLD